MEYSLATTQKVKNRINIRSSNTTPWHIPQINENVHTFS